MSGTDLEMDMKEEMAAITAVWAETNAAADGLVIYLRACPAGAAAATGSRPPAWGRATVGGVAVEFRSDEARRPGTP